MTVFALINELHAQGIELRQEGGQLKLKAPKGALTDDIREQLISNKLDIIAFLQEISASTKAPAILPVSRVAADGRYIGAFPLSFAQERLWFIDQLEPDNAGYNIPAAVIISGEPDGRPLELDYMEQAFNLIITRHENLRTIFPSEAGMARQVILESLDLKLERIDLSHHTSSGTRHEKAKTLCKKEAATPFDLAKGPLIRGKLIKLAEQEHILMLTMHHIISDGWSMGVMIKEFGVIMECLRQGRNPVKSPELPPLPIQYLDYSVWQRKLLQEGGLLEQQLAYWQEKLAGVPESLNLLTDYPRTSAHSFAGAKQAFQLDSALTDQLKNLAEQQGCTLFMTLLAAFKVLLYRYTGEEDICVGSPIANRQYGETEPLVGMFVNTLALRSQLGGDAPFTSLLAQVKTTCLEAYEHQDTPFEKIVDLVQPERNTSVSALFQIMFVLQNAPEESTEEPIQPYSFGSGTSKFDLTIACTDTLEGLVGSIEYKTSLYNPQTIERMAQHFTALCQAIATTPTASISALEFIGEAEKQKLLIDCNNTQADYPNDKCIHQLFIEQVAINPDKIAVVYEDESLSYQQLYDKSHDLALYLQSLGVQPDSLVGLCVERSLDMMVGILGILQAGGAYVPLDPDYPDARLAYMMEDSQVSVILTQEKLQDKLSDLITNATQLIALDQQGAEISDCVSDLKVRQVKLQQEVKPDHLAYVIYTSGSTGKPKGVLTTHQNVRRLFDSSRFGFEFGPSDVWTLFHSFAFDFSVWEMWGALFYGGRLLIIPSWMTRSVDDFYQLVHQEQVTVLNQTPSAFKQFITIDQIKSDPLSLRYVIFGGEALNLASLSPWVERHDDALPQLINMYGITETTVHVTYRQIKNIDVQQNKVGSLIGKPLSDLGILVLDQRSALTPFGVVGELHVWGNGLARGYLNQPELTAEKFISNPFSVKAPTVKPNDVESGLSFQSHRLYKTGDLARWLPDMNGEGLELEFIGRVDHQVKIRGFRIELGEIEAQLNQYPEIKDSVVIAQGQQGNKQLVAYYVARDTKEDHIIDLANEYLRVYLLQTLPDYMMPAAFVSLEAIPLTSNGKVDRRALEHMDVSLESSQAYLAPRNATEKQLVAIWAEVLGLEPEKTGVNDNFFELGGHSLLATQLISRIRSQFAIDLPLKALFEHASIAGFAPLVVSAKINQTPPILPVARTGGEGQPIESFPLSYAQERLWFIDQLEPNSAGYNIPAAVTISGDADGRPLEFDYMEQAFNLIIARHENLRTIFPSEEGQAQQVILDSVDFKLEHIDLSHHTSSETRHEKARQLCQTEAATPFDLTKGPLIRGKLIKLAEQEHILMLTLHHIISDGWSIGVMIREFGVIMDCLRQGRNPVKSTDLPALPIQYLDYSVWQRKLLGEGGVLEQQLAYWQEKLGGVPESLNLATDYPRSSVQSFAGARQAFCLDAEVTDQLRGLAEQQGCTLFMTLLAAFKVLLYRYTGEEDICVGSPIANRHYGETESLIGMFVNTLALRSQVEGDAPFISFLAQVKTTCLEAYEHQDTPFEKIVDLVQPGRNMAISPLFQVMLILQNATEESTEQHIQPYPLGSDTSKFDLTIACTETSDGLAGSIEYKTSLYNPQTIERMAQHLVALCHAIVSTPAANISQLEFIGEAEKQQLLTDFNNTQADYPNEKCIHQLFIEQVAINPDKIAVVYQDESLSYQQLYDKSHELALYLQSLGVQPDSLVGLCVERSCEMMVGILGILQAGGAYVPLDPDYPDDRLTYMLKNSQVKIVLSQEKFQERFSVFAPKNTQLVALDQQWSEIHNCVEQLKSNNVMLRHDAKPDHLAYVIYTSGSTGQPKGVMVEHKALMNRIYWMQQQYSLNTGDIVLQKTPFSFDVSVWEFVWPMMSGASVVFAKPGGHKDAGYLESLINEEKVTTLHFVPSMFNVYLNHAKNSCNSIKQIFCSGEALDSKSVRDYKTRFPKALLHNLYGPTEAAIDVTAYDCSQLDFSLVPIGAPIANTQIHILDKENKPVPIGVPGELHIAGDGLARGYLNRPELTEEKFISNPFNPGTRMYKSGDLCRWLTDGNIEYLGRMDTQVKIRGFRIELGEIEVQLNQYPEINDSVVIVEGTDGNKKLVAYYVAGDTKKDHIINLANEDLRAHLQQTLPDYMLPAAFVSLEAIPLTPNGKVDRRVLERMDVSLESSQAYLAPRNATEEQLVAIWAEVLGLEPEKTGVNDNFFELGGHSLLATQLISRVRSQFAIDVPLKALFEHPSITGFAALVVKAETSKVPSILPVSRTDEDGSAIESFPLSYAQERLWFIDQLEPNSAGYNIPAAVTISGDADGRPLEFNYLEQAFNLIIARHENLRTIFPSEEGRAEQVILDRLDFKLERIDLSHHTSSETRHENARQLCQTEAATPFDLAKGPLIRGKLIKLTEQEHILMLTMHHIISDGWSMGVMIKEFGVIMECLRQGQNPDKSPDLTPLSIQYLDYSVWQRKLLQEGGLLEEQLDYWQEKLAGVPESLNLATDYSRPSMQSFAGAKQAFRLDAGLTDSLRSLAEEQGSTLFMTLLAAFKVLLYRYTGEEDICVGSPIANRHYEETESLVGMFVNTLALRSQLEGEASFISLLAQVKTTCLGAYEHQDTPFEKIVDLVQPGRSMAISPLFQMMFTLQNASEESTEQHLQPYPLGSDSSKFDLTVACTESAEGLAGSIEYKTSLYSPQTVERMAQHFVALCEAIVSTPTANISQLEFIGEAEKQLLLVDCNNTQADYPKDKCIHQLFIEQVVINPDKIAVVYGDEALSYQQLYDKSYDLALYLQLLGVQPDSLVGLCVERSMEMMVGILGILLAGGAYVPLDPEYPDDRLAYMLQDSQTSIVLTQEKLQDKLTDLSTKDTQLIALDSQWSEVNDRAADLEVRQVKLKHEVKPHHLAYMIYTSGSTGQPKGVVVEHRSLHALCVWHKNAFNITSSTRATQVSNIGFDASVWEIWPYLISSARVTIVENEIYLDISKLNEFIKDNKITHSFLASPVAQELLQIDDIEHSYLQYLLIGGDKLSKYEDRNYSFTIVNNYGPTESTVVATSLKIEGRFTIQTIGQPISNTQVYILDQHNNPVPIGVSGELHIAGDGLARGYLNRPELTEEKFIANPFNPGTRMYKSGDLARWLGDGNIEYLGRIDTQVKIRGFRIELGEIEAQLNKNSEIKDCIVIAHEQEGNKQLVAYYVAEGSTQEQVINLANEGLRAGLQQTLPDYMLPAAFVSLEAIPLTANGKVDRRALERTDVSLESSQEYLAPRNATEQQLVAIWADVLDLEPERVGINDNFFELGGHSLLATQLISRIRSQFAIDVPLKALFEHPAICGFAALVVNAETSKVPRILPVSRTDEEGQIIESFPLSFAQERLWFIDQLDPNSAGYNIPAAVTISGDADGHPLEFDHLEQTFNLIIARHANLRTIFPSEEGRAEQVILDSVDFKLERIDLSHHTSNETRHEKARQLCQTEAATPFDLAKGPLIRGKLIKLTEQEHILMLTMHHIISDGWSMGVMIKEFGVIMECLRQGQNPAKSPDLTSLPIQYLDYSVWQRNLLQEGGVLEQQLAYWQEKLAGVPESLNLATDYSRPSVQSFAGAKQAFRLDAGLTDSLRSLAEEQGCTLFMTLLAAFKVLLYRYTGEEDICVGSPIANRHYEETESLIGMLVNTLALRSQLEGEVSFIALLAQVKATCLDAYEHQDAPFEKIVDLVQPGRNMAISPLFQVMLVLQNASEEPAEQHLQPYPLGSDSSKFDLTIACTESAEGLAGSIEYKTSLYNPQTIERMAQHFVALCEAIVSTPTANISELKFIGEAEKQLLLVDYNNTQADYPKDKCIHQLFIEQVAINPDRIAVVYEDESLSYQQLYDKSQDLALYLQSLGVQPDSLVGLCVERSLEVMVGILAILQAGGAYVPLDPDYPDERLTYMLNDSQASIVLTQEKLRGKLNGLLTQDTQLIALDQQWLEINHCADDLRTKNVKLQQEVKPHHLAYVIYTSGSTGQPKGVMVEHRSVMNLINQFASIKALRSTYNCSAWTNLSFDVSIYELLSPLVAGATLYPIPNNVRTDSSLLFEWLGKNNIVSAYIPSLFLTEYREFIADKKHLMQRLLVGVEPIEASLLQEIKNTFKDGSVINGYGPSETTICSTLHTLEFNDNLSAFKNKNVPIGRPVDNTQIYILDQYSNPQPIGVPGELHISGEGLSRGYLNRVELTKKKFIPNPFNPGTRMYKSGDLARWLDDGNIEFLGRIDTQVKIRGFRIELGEIEAQLNRYPKIRDSVVVAQGQEANKQLIACYVANGTKNEQIIQLANDDLRACLQQTLPAYMVPARFVSLETIPLTPNGKVDRRALECMDVSLESSQDYLAPRNAMEKQLVAVWAELLDLEPEMIGVNDNFFELGGHSLLAVRLMAKINAQFKRSLPLAVLFSASSTAALAKLISSKEDSSFDVLVPIQAKGDKPPIFAVPGAGGNVLSFQPLSHALGSMQPFYGLQAVGLDGKTPPLDSVEKTAIANITALKSIQATGPYRIIGHSYGGVVAYEMARILVAQDEEIASLILLDSFSPLVMQKQDASDETTTLLEACISLANLYGINLNLDRKSLQKVSKDKRSETISSMFNSHGVDVNTEQFITFYNVFEANRLCYQTYKPSTFSHKVNVSLFRAIERHHDRGMFNDYGWNELLVNPIQIVDVKANHFSMLDKNHIQQIVKKISS